MLNIPVLSGAFLLCIHEFMPAGVISADNILIGVNIKATDCDRGFCIIAAVWRNNRRALQALMLKGKGSQPFFPHQQKATR